MARIALDAMGGDLAPVETTAGAVEAHRRGVDVVLVGRHAVLEAELAKYDAKLPIVDAPDVIGMAEDPARGLREKPGASVLVSARLVAEGNADGFLSAGSTGAAMAAASIVIGRIKGVSRPPIAVLLPAPDNTVILVDMGANPVVKPEQLVQFAVMGSIASTTLVGIEKPRVGLLSNGEEPSKGRDLEKAAHALLQASSLNFVGNVEGRDIANDKADVIVTDGFTGNILLKTIEGTAQIMARLAADEAAQLGAEIQDAIGPVLSRIKSRLDYETYGGAQLLGVKGVVVISHGSSTRASIANALVMAQDGAEQDLPGQTAASLASL